MIFLDLILKPVEFLINKRSQRIFNLILNNNVNKIHKFLKKSKYHNESACLKLYGRSFTPLSLSLYIQNIEMINLFLEYDSKNYSRWDYNQLEELIQTENIEILSLFTKFNFEITKFGSNFLSNIIKLDKITVFNLFLDYFKTKGFDKKNKDHLTRIYYAFKEACKSENFKYVEKLSELITDIDFIKPNYNSHSKLFERKTPLMLASENSNLEMDKYLVAKGANVNAVYFEEYSIEKSEVTPLTSASKRRNSDLINFLINNGANIEENFIYAIKLNDEFLFRYIHNLSYRNNLIKLDYQKAINEAVRKGNQKFLKILLFWGADVRKKIVNKSEYPLNIAIRGEVGIFPDVIKELIKNNALFDKNDSMCSLSWLIYYGKVKSIIAVYTNSFQYNLTYQRFNYQKVELLSEILKYSFFEDSYYYDIRLQLISDLFFILIRRKTNINLVIEKLAKEKDRRSDNKSALGIVINFLIANNVTFNTNSNECIFNAINYDNFSHLEPLLDFGFDINQLNEKNQTPLTVISQKYSKTFYFVLRNTLNKDLRDVYGNTALTYAVRFGNYHYVKELLKYTVNINNVNNCGNSILMDSILFGRTRIFLLLLRKKAIFQYFGKEFDEIFDIKALVKNKDYDNFHQIKLIDYRRNFPSIFRKNTRNDDQYYQKVSQIMYVYRTKNKFMRKIKIHITYFIDLKDRYEQWLRG